MASPVDVADLVMVTPAAAQRWAATCLAACTYLCAMHDIPADSLPEEVVVQGPDGTLLVYVDLPKLGRVSMVFGRYEWIWMPSVAN